MFPGWVFFSQLTLTSTYFIKKINDGILGLIVGDALGVPVEFQKRSDLGKNPVTKMSGYGTYHQPPGTWSDDSSMTLCTADELSKGYDLDSITQSYVRWIFDAHWSPRGQVFDYGGTTMAALEKVKKGIPLTEAGEKDEYSNGNGSLMRILPLLYVTLQMEDRKERFKIIREVSAITHAHLRSCLACFYYLEFAAHLVKEKDATPVDAYAAANATFEKLVFELNVDQQEIEKFHRLLSGDIQELPEDEIRTEGYVIYTLEASIWGLLNTNNYKEAVLRSVNLGEDTDTTGAVTGGLAGLYYGREAIPQEWIEQLARLKDIEEVLVKLEGKYF